MLQDATMIRMSMLCSQDSLILVKIPLANCSETCEGFGRDGSLLFGDACHLFVVLSMLLPMKYV